VKHPGVAKPFNSRTEFATYWPPEGQIQRVHATSSSQCCCTAVHSRKRAALKNVQEIWQAGLNWAAGRMWFAGRSLDTPMLT